MVIQFPNGVQAQHSRVCRQLQLMKVTGEIQQQQAAPELVAYCCLPACIMTVTYTSKQKEPLHTLHVYMSPVAEGTGRCVCLVDGRWGMQGSSRKGAAGAESRS